MKTGFAPDNDDKTSPFLTWVWAFDLVLGVFFDDNKLKFQVS